MNNKKIFSITAILIFILFLVPAISAQSTEIPSWVKGVANFWVEGNIDDAEFGDSISFLIEQGIVKVDMSKMADTSELQNKISILESENSKLVSENNNLKSQNMKLQSQLNAVQSSQKTTTTQPVSVPNNFKLYDLLPNTNEISSDMTVERVSEYNSATKSFYYANAGQTKYKKNVTPFEEYRANIYQFSDANASKNEYPDQAKIIKDKIGWAEVYSKTGYAFVESDNCIAVHIEAKASDELKGVCLVGKYLIYITMEGYWPGMDDEFIDMMNIAIKKTNSVT